jgi:hypothetical protein
MEIATAVGGVDCRRDNVSKMNWSLRSLDEAVIKNLNQIKLHVHMILRSRVEPTVHLHVLSEPFTCETQVKLSDERLL